MDGGGNSLAGAVMAGGAAMVINGQIAKKMIKYITIIIFSIFLSSGISHGQPMVSGVRDIELQNVYPYRSTNITITITNTINQALSLQEKLPSDWILTRISDDADTFKASTNEWVWFSMGADVTKTIRYSITVPAGAAPGTYNIEGSISNSSGIIIGITGDSSITVLESAAAPAATRAEGSSGLPPAQTSSKTSARLQNIEISINPAEPAAGDNISIKVELTYPTAGYAVEFGETSIKDKTISFNIKSTPPAGMAAQVITTYSHEYHPGYLSEGTYAYSINVNEALVDRGSFLVAPKTQETKPSASPIPAEPVKTPGFTLPFMIVLISYIIIKIRKGDECGRE